MNEASRSPKAVKVAGEDAVEVTPIALEAVIDAEAAAATDHSPDRKVMGRLMRGSASPVDFELDQLPELAKDDANLAWVDLSEYSADDLGRVAKMLDLHRLSVEAALDSWQRPRIDSFPDHFYLSTTVATANSRELTITAGELGIWVGKNFVVTAHRRPLPFLEAALVRLEQSPDLAQLHTAFVLYILLDELVNHYAVLFEELEDVIEATEEKALKETSDEFLANLLHLKRYVFALGRLAEQHQTVFAAFSRPDFSYVSGPDIEPYFRDVQQSLERVTDRLLAAREAVNGAFDIYVSHMAHRTNSLITILTVISTLIFPATLIVGIAQVVLKLPLITSPLSLGVLAAGLIMVPGALVIFVLRGR